MAMQEGTGMGITPLRSFHHQQKRPGKNKSAPGEELPRHLFVQKKNAEVKVDENRSVFVKSKKCKNVRATTGFLT